MLPQQVTNYISRPRFLYAAVFIWMTVTTGSFLSPFLEHLGLDESEIGIALSIARLVDMIGNGTAGAWADRRERLNPKQGRVHVIALGVIGASCATLCHGWATRAWQHIILRSIFSGFASLITVVLDGLTIDYLGEKRRGDYGKERLHGAIWWAVAHWGLSILVENMGFRSIYMMTMITGPGMISCLVIYVMHQPKRRPMLVKRSSDIIDDLDDLVEEEQEPKSYQTANKYASLQISERPVLDKPDLSLRALVDLLLASLSSIAFFAAAFSLASGQAIDDSFSFIFFESLGSSFTTLGWVVIICIAIEAPMFHVASKLLRLGAGNILLLASACFIIRIVGYSYLPEGRGWMVLLLEPLHGITYACTQIAVIDFVAQLMPQGYQASGQGLAQCFRGLGGILGIGLGGFIAEADGDRFVFRVAAAVVACGSLFFLVCKCLEGMDRADYRSPDDEDDGSVSVYKSERQPLTRPNLAEP